MAPPVVVDKFGEEVQIAALQEFQSRGAHQLRPLMRLSNPVTPLLIQQRGAVLLFHFVGGVSEVGRGVFRVPDLKEVAGGPDELRTAVVGEAGDVRHAPLHEDDRFSALLVPVLEPVAAFLNGGPVQVDVQRVAFAEVAGGVVVDHARGIHLFDPSGNFERFAAGCIVPDFRHLFSVDGKRILIAFVSGCVVIHRVENDGGIVADQLHQAGREGEILSEETGVADLPVDGGKVRKRKGADHADIVGRAVECFQISDISGSKAVICGLEKVVAEFFEAFQGFAAGRVAGLRGKSAGMMKRVSPQMDFFPVQQKVAAGNGEFPVAETDRKGFFQNAAGAVFQKEFHRVLILGSVEIPGFQGAGLPDPEPSVCPDGRGERNRRKRNGGRIRKRTGRESGFLESRLQNRVGRKSFRGEVKGDFSLPDMGIDPDVAEFRSVRRDGFQKEISRDSFSLNGSALLHRPVGGGEDHAFFQRTSLDQNREFLQFPGNEMIRQVKASAGKEKVSRLLSVHENLCIALEQAEIEADFPSFPCRRDPDRPFVPCGCQLDQVLFLEFADEDLLFRTEEIPGVFPRPDSGDLEPSPSGSGIGNAFLFLFLMHRIELPERVQADSFLCETRFPPRPFQLRIGDKRRRFRNIGLSGPDQTQIRAFETSGDTEMRRHDPEENRSFRNPVNP